LDIDATQKINNLTFLTMKSLNPHSASLKTNREIV